MSQYSSTETLKDPRVTEHSVNSSPSLSSQDEKDISTPSTPAESINLEDQAATPPPYHVFTRSRKLQMVIIVSFAAIFSPLSSNIYFPALSEISKELDVSMSLATLTVTVYMIAQGLAPSFWGSFSDVLGRRVIFIGTFLVYIIANIALGVSTNYTQLMVFRALQAAGSAATISIGAGVIGDITTSAERGSLIGIFGGVRMLGQGIGPVFGGILSEYLGFRSIFWFLIIVSGISLLSILFFLPETLRTIAGNGTVPLKGMYRPLIYSITGQKDAQEGSTPSGKKSNVTWRTVVAPLTFLGEKDVFITLFFGSIVYTVWSMVTSSTSDLFEQEYGLNSMEVGLTYLPRQWYRMHDWLLHNWIPDGLQPQEDRARQHNLPIDTRINSKTHPDFPIEYARMRNTWWITAIFIVSVAVYGVSLRTHLALPIILQFIIAYGSTAIFTINSALVIDLYPGASASATAVNNLMRCLIGAAGVAAVQPIIDAITAQWTFVLLAGITIAMLPLLMVEMRWGYQWRLERHERSQKKENKV
ncbi:hypothetical protein N7499_002242 [Penicillium canescens]|nr:hypothetical protein N7499_002242 [Penicillium canescens]KAJ6165857.1 hypothetical protein N7485_009101 [Penicillium canescens]